MGMKKVFGSTQRNINELHKESKSKRNCELQKAVNVSLPENTNRKLSVKYIYNGPTFCRFLVVISNRLTTNFVFFNFFIVRDKNLVSDSKRQNGRMLANVCSHLTQNRPDKRIAIINIRLCQVLQDMYVSSFHDILIITAAEVLILRTHGKLVFRSKNKSQ